MLNSLLTIRDRLGCPRRYTRACPKSSSRRGQTVVESALVALVFLVTLIGVFDLGQIFFIHQTFVERVRNAARYAVVNTYDDTAFKNMVLYNQPTVPTGRTSGIFGLTADMVTVTHAGADTNDDRIVVSVTNYPYRFFSPLIAGVFQGRTIVVSLPSELP